MTNTQTIAGYVRVSRVAGREGDSFQSPQVQEDAIRSFARARGWDVDVVEHELDASGGTMNRPKLQVLIERVESGDLAGLVFARLDRFGRTVSGAIQEIERMAKSGGFVATCDGVIDTSAGAGPIAVAIRNILLAFAQMERDLRAEGFELAKSNAVERGVHIAGTVPVGYIRGEDGRLELDPAKYDAVRKAFELRAAGSSLRDIAAMLDVALPGGPSGVNGRWNKRTIRQLLGNPAYRGQARQGVHSKDDAHEAIVTRRTFDDAQAVNTRNAGIQGKAGRPAKSLLAGIVKCGGCGGGMARSTAGGSYVVYSCKAESCPERASCMAPALDSLVTGVALAELAALAAREIEELDDDDQPADQGDLHAALEAARTQSAALADPAFLVAIGPERAAAAAVEADRAVEEAEAALADAAPVADDGSMRAAAMRGDDADWTSFYVPDWEAKPWEFHPLEDQRRYVARVIERVTVKRAPRGTLLADRVTIEGR